MTNKIQHISTLMQSVSVSFMTISKYHALGWVVNLTVSPCNKQATGNQSSFETQLKIDEQIFKTLHFTTVSIWSNCWCHTWQTEYVASDHSLISVHAQLHNFNFNSFHYFPNSFQTPLQTLLVSGDPRFIWASENIYYPFREMIY